MRMSLGQQGTSHAKTTWRSGSAIDGNHVPFVVALAGGRRKVLQSFDLLGTQLDAVGG
jgi:hypothetical protein